MDILVPDFGSIFTKIHNPVLSRVIAAIFGGYLLANSVAILLPYLLPGSKANGVMTGILVSFLIYACAAMWVFSAKSAWQAWAGILFSCLLCISLVTIFMPNGLFSGEWF